MANMLDEIPTRPRRLRVWLLLVTILAVVGTGLAPAEAQNTRQRLNDARQRYQALQQQLNRLAEEHARHQQQLDQTRGRISATRRSIEEAEAEAKHLKDHLSTRVRTAYRMGGLGFFQILLSAEDFRDFSLRVIMLQRQASLDEDIILRLRKSRAEMQVRQRELERQREQQAHQVAALRSQARTLNAAFEEAQSLVGRLSRELSAEEARRLAAARTRASRGAGGGGGRVAAAGSGQVVALQACPVPGPRAFSNDWGAPRSGGRRHRGNDIFAPNGAPSAAVVNGTISRLGSGGLGGLSVWLRGDDGNSYYYAHMSGFTVSAGQRVSAGQTIAYVGNTGNARGGASHVHFEVHWGGRGAINPYWSLIRVC